MRQRECKAVAFELRNLAINCRDRLLVATAKYQSTAIGVSERKANKRIIYSPNNACGGKVLWVKTHSLPACEEETACGDSYCFRRCWRAD